MIQSSHVSATLVPVNSSRYAVLAVLSLITCLLIGGPLVSLSIYLPILARTEGWSDTALNGASTAMLVSQALSAIVSGNLVSRMSPRPVILAGALLAGVGCWFAARSETSTQFVTAIGIVGVGIGAATLVSSIPVISSTFGPKRGTALGIYFSSMALAAAFLPMLSSTLIASTDWRTAMLVTAAVVAAGGLAVLLLRLPSPSDAASSATDEDGASALFKPLAAEVLKLGAFWLLLAVMTLALINAQGILFATVGYLLAGGMTTGSAVGVFSVTNLFAVPSLFLTGLLADKLGARQVILGGAIVQAIGTLALLGVFLQGAPGYFAIGIFSLFWGVSCGIASQVGPMLLEDVVGPRLFGTMLGITSATTGLISALAPLSTSMMRAWDGGSYHLPFNTYAAMCLFNIPLILMIRSKRGQPTSAISA